nr:PAS domain S-box protein [uncultured Lacibacter sp.]
MNKDTRQYQILLVEDNPGDILLIEEFIDEKFAAPVLVKAKSFRDAADAISKKMPRPDVVLLDLSLPDKGGEELISAVLKSCPFSPVIVLTGHADLDFSIYSLSLGATDYLLKDEINAGVLYKSIVYGIERKRSVLIMEESERRYSDLFHLSPIPMWVYDTESLVFLDVNEAAIRHYGFLREEFMQMTIRDIRPAEDLPILEEALNEMRQNKRKFKSGIFRHVKKNGEIVIVKIESNSIDYKGRKGSVVLANDVTELLQAQESLKNAYQNIVEVEEQERERFAAEIHDGVAQNLIAIQMIFNNLLISFPGLSDFFHTNILKDTIEKAVVECRDIVYDVRPKELIDNGITAMIWQLLEKINAAGNIRVAFDEQVSLDKCFKYNELFHIYRIIQENLNNTLKYAKATEVQLKVQPEKEYVVLLFSDNGTGISDEIINTPSSFLSIKRRIKVLQGELFVYSNQPKGVTFKYHIPLVN